MSVHWRSRSVFGAILTAGVFIVPVVPAFAQALSYGTTARYEPAFPQYAAPGDASDDVASDELPAPLRRQMVAYPNGEPPGTIVIDTAHTFLYLTLGDGKALRYGIGVGRQGFTWSGVETISRKAEWPDWIPPAEMVARQPYLPRWVGGGPGNPLGARALYLGNSDYRIHGTNDPTSIGKHVSSGCIRLQDADVIDLYQRVGIGTKVVVLPNQQHGVSIENGDGPLIASTSVATQMTAQVMVQPGIERRPTRTGSPGGTPLAGIY